MIFEEERQWHKLGKPVDRNEWGMSPPTVNAYFDPQMNDINFPAGVLQPPLYDRKLDDAPNYGNTGATIGHELTHAFDDEGRQFDCQGQPRRLVDPRRTPKGFEDRINCVRDQYAGYVIVDDIHINSKLTSGEDVADLGGTWLAYIAWKEQTAAQQLGDRDGFTPDQRFFVGMAQWACENERPENLRVSAITDPHSPGFARINGVVSNLPQFQQAFGCKAGAAHGPHTHLQGLVRSLGSWERAAVQRRSREGPAATTPVPAPPPELAGMGDAARFFFCTPLRALRHPASSTREPA